LSDRVAEGELSSGSLNNEEAVGL